RNPTPEARQVRQARVLENGRKLAAGEGNGQTLPLNAAWDEGLLRSFLASDFDRFKTMTDEEIAEMGGRGGQEIRAWIASFACLRAIAPYEAQVRYYSAIDEWLDGMALATARPVAV
ncbi:MAG: hypothetical protein PHU07_10995, partial [Acidocella sp.]|nr:hypothetical protein [Acidocella sp.]